MHPARWPVWLQLACLYGGCLGLLAFMGRVAPLPPLDYCLAVAVYAAGYAFMVASMTPPGGGGCTTPKR